MSEKLLEVKNLKKYFYTDEGVVKSVDDVSFDVEKGKTLGIVGESGCGKSITSLSIMQLVETPPGKMCIRDRSYCSAHCDCQRNLCYYQSDFSGRAQIDHNFHCQHNCYAAWTAGIYDN